MSSIRHLYNALRGAWRERLRWSSTVQEPGPVRVYYGHGCLPGVVDVGGGGIVKCQDLARVFPNTPVRPNLLYIVSSALEPYAVSMARSAKRAGARIVINQNGVAYPAWHGSGWEATNKSMQLLHEMADYIFYQSAFCKLSAERFLGKAGTPAEVLHNAVDTGVFRPARRRGGGGELVLLTAGSHTKRYRVACAIDALVALRGSGIAARLIVAGKYCWRDERVALEEARDYARGRCVGDVVEFLGPYSQEDAANLMNRADILLHATYNDSCPRLVLEAMACGLPVVCSGSGGTPELIGSTAGLGVPAPLDWEREHAPDPLALAAAVVAVFRDLGTFSAAARDRAVRLFDVKPWIERHRAVFSSLGRW